MSCDFRGSYFATGGETKDLPFHTGTRESYTFMFSSMLDLSCPVNSDSTARASSLVSLASLNLSSACRINDSKYWALAT